MSKVNRFVKTICYCLDVPRQVNLLTCQDVFDVFACSMCLSHKCSIKKKVILKRDEDVLGEVKKFCYFGGIFSSYSTATAIVQSSCTLFVILWL